MSASAVQLEYLFFICFVSLTNCSQPCRRVRTLANASPITPAHLQLVQCFWPCQYICKEANASPVTPTRPHASKRVRLRSTISFFYLFRFTNEVSNWIIHVDIANASACKQTCPEPCQRVPGHISTPASRLTCPPLRYCFFFSICFVSLTICPQPRQRDCTQANVSAFKQICPWPRQHESFFLFLLFH